MAKQRIARAKVTTGRKKTVIESDFAAPDTSLTGIYLQDIASALTVLDDLHCDALQLDYSSIGAAAGCTRNDVRDFLMTAVLEQAGRHVVEARQALHDLFREVQLKPTLEQPAVPRRPLAGLDGGRP